MQLYRVTSTSGELIMDAPARTLQIILRLNEVTLDRLYLETRQLGAKCSVALIPSVGGLWYDVEIERLETPIALSAQLVLTEHRLSLARAAVEKLRKPTPFTALGELLCDE